MPITLPQVFLKNFASKNRLSGLSISGTLVENELNSVQYVYFIVSSWMVSTWILNMKVALMAIQNS